MEASKMCNQSPTQHGNKTIFGWGYHVTDYSRCSSRLGESNKLVWNFTDISQHSDNGGIDTLRARLEIANGPSTPSILTTQFNCEGTTLSGIDFELSGSGYRISLVKRRFVAGELSFWGFLGKPNEVRFRQVHLWRRRHHAQYQNTNAASRITEPVQPSRITKALGQPARFSILKEEMNVTNVGWMLLSFFT